MVEKLPAGSAALSCSMYSLFDSRLGRLASLLLRVACTGHMSCWPSHDATSFPCQGESCSRPAHVSAMRSVHTFN